jgi:hypothetical protein
MNLEYSNVAFLKFSGGERGPAAPGSSSPDVLRHLHDQP